MSYIRRTFIGFAGAAAGFCLMQNKKTNDTQRKKVFNDSVHGHIELPKECVLIIDTPQFQRLRHIKQLGGAYYVYPGAAHNRFEHGIGTCHLAQRYAETLKKSACEITHKDILCVAIAGLCHDLGHGPFSHIFESHFIRAEQPGKIWNHERGSLMMFDHLLKENKDVADCLKKTLDEKDINFIKSLISKKTFLDIEKKEMKERCQRIADDWQIIKEKTNRGKDKAFLFEIVANEENGIDVDKFDYFARDCHHLGYKNSFDHNRLMAFARVIEVDEDGEKRKHICFRDKEAERNIYDLFYSRALLHHRTCQHKTIKIIEIMHMEALLKVKDIIKIKGKGGKLKTVVECVDDMVAYTNLTDNIFERILRADVTLGEDDVAKSLTCEQRKDLEETQKILEKMHGDKRLTPEQLNDLEETQKILVKVDAAERLTCEQLKDLKEAQQILERVEKRQHYKCIGAAIWDGKKGPLQTDDKKETEEQIAGQIVRRSEGPMCKDDIRVNVVKFDYGKKTKNPVDKVYLYSKNKPGTAMKVTRKEISLMLPSVYYEKHVRVYATNREKEKELKKAFTDWCKDNSHQIIMGKLYEDE